MSPFFVVTTFSFKKKKNMKKLLLSSLILSFSALLQAQTVTISFSGRDTSNHYLRLDRVDVKNLAEGWQETLLWPDTVLTMHVGTGINDAGDLASSALQLSASSANPFHGTTTADLVVKEAGKVTMEITDISGRNVASLRETTLQPGTHHLRITLSATGIYFLTARMQSASASLKLVNSSEGGLNTIEHTGFAPTFTTSKGSTNNAFHLGDPLEYIGYANIIGIEMESGHILDAPNASHSSLLQFPYATGNYDTQPCPSSPTVTDQDGNVYNTVIIGNQCWMKENLRVTHYSNGEAIPMGDSTSITLPYRYCPDDNAANVAIFGYLYNWPAVMHGAASSDTNPSGVQGVCPKGWHMPSHAEWEQLASYVGSQSAYQCDNSSFKNAKALASQTTWYFSMYDPCSPGYNPSTNNATGFSAITAGCYGNTGSNYHIYLGFGTNAQFWSTTRTGCHEYIYSTHISHSNIMVSPSISSDMHEGFSVRCIRN